MEITITTFAPVVLEDGFVAAVGYSQAEVKNMPAMNCLELDRLTDELGVDVLVF